MIYIIQFQFLVSCTCSSGRNSSLKQSTKFRNRWRKAVSKFTYSSSSSCSFGSVDRVSSFSSSYLPAFTRRFTRLRILSSRSTYIEHMRMKRPTYSSCTRLVSLSFRLLSRSRSLSDESCLLSTESCSLLCFKSSRTAARCCLWRLA